jgi:hypothetical protein
MTALTQGADDSRGLVDVLTDVAAFARTVATDTIGSTDNNAKALDKPVATDVRGLTDSVVNLTFVRGAFFDDRGLTDTATPAAPRFYVHGTAARGDRSATGEMLASTPVLSADWTFTVASSGTATPPSAPPATPSPPVVVGRWQLEDPVTSAVYQFTVNPKAQGGMILPPALTEKQTTTGQPITNEGAARATEMVVTGFLLTEAQYDVFVTWTAKPYRIFLTDDLGRQYVTFIKAFQPVLAKPYPTNLWFCTYTLRLLVFGRAS